MQREYTSVKEQATVEIIINKSRFIASCYPVDTEEEALDILAKTRKKYSDASHNCYAYSIGDNGSIARYSDDGEPSGTAGLPMMEAVKNKNVTNVLVIVTRYFGGVLLGAGGLVRAYSKGACEAIDAAGIVRMLNCTRFTVAMDYSRYGALEGLLRSRGIVEDIEFTNEVTARVLIRLSDKDAFCADIIEKTDARVCPREEETMLYPFPE